MIPTGTSPEVGGDLFSVGPCPPLDLLAVGHLLRPIRKIAYRPPSPSGFAAPTARSRETILQAVEKPFSYVRRAWHWGQGGLRDKAHREPLPSPLSYRNLPNFASFPRSAAEPIRILINRRDYATLSTCPPLAGQITLPPRGTQNKERLMDFFNSLIEVLAARKPDAHLTFPSCDHPGATYHALAITYMDTFLHSLISCARVCDPVVDCPQ
jgi:hypothetical protein